MPGKAPRGLLRLEEGSFQLDTVVLDWLASLDAPDDLEAPSFDLMRPHLSIVPRRPVASVDLALCNPARRRPGSRREVFAELGVKATYDRVRGCATVVAQPPAACATERVGGGT